MSRLVHDYLEIDDVTSLGRLIERLSVIRDSLPATADPEVRLRGDDHFGHHIAIRYKRPLTAEETDRESRHLGDADENELRAVA